MLQIMRRGQRWVLWFVIVVVGGAFVFFLGSGGGSGPSSSAQVAVRVGDRKFDFRDLDRVRQAQIAEYRRVLGDAFDPEAARDYLDQMAAGSLVPEGMVIPMSPKTFPTQNKEEQKSLVNRLIGRIRSL